MSILIACAVALPGCGGSASPSFSYQPPKVGRPAPSPAAFPTASGKTLRQVLNSADAPLAKLGLKVEPTAMVFYAGRNRYPIQITTKDGAPVDDVEIALYLAKVPAAKPGKRHHGKAAAAQAQTLALDAPAEGPFPARMDTLATDPQFTAGSTAEDPLSATAVYIDSLTLPASGEWRVAAVVKDGNETFSTTLSTLSVGEFQRVPRIGQLAPLIHTPTAMSAGNLATISTRRPPSTMNEVDFASVLGRKPVVLLFASPKFSWNHTAGPTLDVAEQVRAHFKSRAVFINVEIYNENDPNKGVRPQARAYHLPSQPWLFAINRHGRIVGEIEGGVGVAELTQLVSRAVEG